ncbi:hypothetical protein HYC85_001674 [Camellia sinensis]|uniref:Uncharacterized protein n=1 Tax=Camellia sinensis TaxID=4442 RepID=A0A7J7I6M0_CAMSI|nr:hypothetical protein HYC85_001674 [Camellia sinensis]
MIVKNTGSGHEDDRTAGAETGEDAERGVKDERDNTRGDEETKKPAYEALKTWNGNKEKGGFRASSFLFVLVLFENMAFVANMVSLVLYFSQEMHFDLAGSANTLTNLMGATFLLSIVGAFISDTYLDRFRTCLIFGLLEVLALVMMTIQAHDSKLKPSPYNKSTCVKGGIAVMFYASLYLLALGNGGVRGALAPLGADQFDHKDPKEAKALASYFNYLLLSTTVGAAVGVTIIVWVIVVSFKNRKMSLPESPTELYEITEKEFVSQNEKIPHTTQFSCLDKAAILGADRKPSPWTVCTVTQVEEVKILTRMMPIIASTIIMNTCLAQLQTFSVQQGYRMNRLLNKFEVPAPSVPVIPLVFMSILLPIYEFVFVPAARKLTGHPSGITQLQRVGVGLVLSAVSMAVAALVEVRRKQHSLKNPLKPISLFWLSFQYGIFGIADMFTLVGLLEFFYKEAPVYMRSLSTSFTWISLSLGYFLSTVFIDIINSVTRRVTKSKQGWLHGQDLDHNNLDLFYWFLAILSCLNFVNYLYWSSWYKYKTEEPKIDSSVAMSVSKLPFLKEESNAGNEGKEASSCVENTQGEEASSCVENTQGEEASSCVENTQEEAK